MNPSNFIEEVKAAVCGRWPNQHPKSNTKNRRKVHKTPEEIWEEENRKVYKD